MKIIQINPGLLPIPPNGWGAVEKIIWETHQAYLSLGYESEIKYLDEISPNEEDIIHIHVANLANLAHERGIKYYFTMHDHHAFLYGKESQVYKENLQAIKNAQKAFVPAVYLIEYFDNIPEYFSHGVNMQYFQYKKRDIEDSILCVANNGYIFDQTVDRKGFRRAVEAAKSLNLPITICGPENNKNFFDKNKDLLEYKKLTVLYNLNEEELLKQYYNHTIFLHLSELEAGQPNLTLLEAKSTGMHVIGTFENSNNYFKNFMILTDRNNIEHIIFSIKTCLNSEAGRLSHTYNWLEKSQEMINNYLYEKNDFRNQLDSIYNFSKKLNFPSAKKKLNINYNFINGAFLEIKGGSSDIDYKIQFINKTTNNIEYEDTIKTNHWVKAAKQYYVNWRIKISYKEEELIIDMDLKDKRVYIALDSKAVGDTLSWFPYVKEFQKKHNCKIICSTFHNNLFKKQYENEDFQFIEPGEKVDNIYAQYTIGWFYNNGKINLLKNPKEVKNQPLTKTSSDILGLYPYIELKPLLNLKYPPKEKLICIAIHGSAQAKYWNNPTGWQELVDELKSKGYRIVLISKEEDGYMGNKHPTGIEQISGNLQDTIDLLERAYMFIGISSGLSWLSWAVGTMTVLISGFSEAYTEGTFNTIRITAPPYKCSGCFNTDPLDAGDWNWCPRYKGTDKQFECSKLITSKMVLDKINPYL